MITVCRSERKVTLPV